MSRHLFVLMSLSTLFSLDISLTALSIQVRSRSPTEVLNSCLIITSSLGNTGSRQREAKLKIKLEMKKH